MSAFKDWLNGLTSKSTPVDADELYLRDSVGSASNKLTWANLKATAKTYFDSLYLAIGNLYWDATNTLSQRNGTNAQAYLPHNTYTNASNYERGFIRWASNIFEIGAESAGTGTANRTVRLSTYDTIQFWNSQYGYSMGGISGGIWNVNTSIAPVSAGGATLGGNGSNGGNGWKTLGISTGTTATVGNVTMNKSAGRVKADAAATSVVVTNDRVSAASRIFGTIATNDATAAIKSIVPAAGSFTINLVGPTGQVDIDFFVVQSAN